MYVFAYGSLRADRGGTPCRLAGYRCGWHVAMDNRRTIPGYKVYVDPETGEQPPVHVAFLSIEPAAGGAVDGVAFPVSEAQLAALDRRERNYDRQDVTGHLTPDPGGRVWAYVGSAGGRRRLADGRRNGTAVVTRGYLEHVGVPTDLPVVDLLRRDVGA